MYNPTRDQARRFLIDAWAKRRTKLPATPLETLAADPPDARLLGTFSGARAGAGRA